MFDRELISSFNIQDIFLLPILVIILFAFYKKRVLSKFREDKTLFNIFIAAFFFKLFCTIFHTGINQYVYNKQVDSFSYYLDILKIKSYLLNNSGASLFDLYFNKETFTDKTGMEFAQFGAESTANVPIFAMPLSIIFFNSYLCISFFVGYFALMACYRLYIVFFNVFPNCKVEAAIASVLLPGLTFWSSILLKDTFSLIGLGYGVFYFWELFIKKKISVKGVLLLLLSLYFIYSFKPYVLIILLTFFLWFGINILQKAKSYFIKIFAFFIFILVGVLGLNVIVKELNNTETGPLAAYKTETLTDQIQNLNKSYESQEDNGSSFSFGEIDYSNPVSVLSNIPFALSAVFFQPFIWQVRKPIMFLSAIESAIILYLFLYTIFKSKFLGFFKIIFKNSFLISFFLFCILFGTAVAFSSPNFGTIARYKIPCMPFIVFILLVVRRTLKDELLKKA